MPNQPSEADGACVRVRHGAVDLIWLNEPKRRNALSIALRSQLTECIAASLADSNVRAIVVAGAGGNFSSGGDLSIMADLKPAAALDRLRAVHMLVRMMCEAEKPIVAAVEGWAVGAGLSLMAACDIVVAGSTARFSMPFARVGLMPDLGILHTLPLRIGIGRARLMAMTAQVIDADRAAGWGLVDQLAEPGEAVGAAVSLAQSIAENAPLSLAATKRVLSRLPLQQEDVLTMEANAQALLYQSEDFAEGARAFFEKRVPRFKRT